MNNYSAQGICQNQLAANPVQQQTKRGAVIEAIDRLEHCVTALDSVLGNFVSRCNPIMSNLGVPAPDKEASRAIADPVIASQIEIQNDRLTLLANRIRDLTECIEL